MSTLSLLPVSLLESLGLKIVQQAADAAFGAGVLTLSDDSSGIGAGLKLPGGQTVNLDDLAVNSSGISGRLFIDGLETSPLSATLFDGFTIALTAFDLTLAQNGLAASHIGGHLTLPFFTDSSGKPKTVDVEIATKADGSLSISLSAVESVQSSTPDGLVQLIYDLPGGAGTVEIDVASLEVDKSAGGTWTIIISGSLILEVAGLSWPSIELRGLGIDSKGHISLQGGWIDLPSQMALDFYGFHLGLQKLGFGSDQTGKWIGFNGDLNLVEGLSLGGSVRGLKINLTTGAVSLDGVSISFEIPDVLTIDGEVDHIHVNAHTPQDLADAGLNASIFDFIAPYPPSPAPNPPLPVGGNGKQVDVFAGKVKVVIEAAGDLEVDANFIVGNFGGQSVFFLDIDAELPVGIPIFLDVALYGLQGLVATGLQPDPEPAHTWWEWYKFPNSTSGAGGPDVNATPDYSATDVHKWLVPKQGAFAIGAGATIGTEADDGFTVSAAITFVLLLPGPIISLIGKANILSKRIGGASQDANFEAMATYDGNAKTFDLTVDAKYEIPIVLDIEATAELYVGGGSWFFALGKPPHEKRVKARIFDLFESDAYFVISDQGLITGTWTGYKNSWSFGPLSASIDAYLATLAAIQWSPLQIGGGLELYGNIHLSAFGIGFGITADALLEGCAPHPFWVHGELSVELDLPWPLPDVGATISLSWGGDDGSVPPAPLALSHIDAILSDHCDAADKQASDHYVLLAHRDKGFSPDLPIQYDPVTPGILDLSGDSLTNWQSRTAASPILPDLVPDDSDSSKQMAPVVPQDSHFTLNFAHPTVDGTGAFDNAIPWDAPNPLPNPAPPLFPKDADVETPKLPTSSLIGPDDMSNINPTPPTVQFDIRHTLTEVSLYQFDGGSSTWELVCSTPPHAVADPPIGQTQLSGVWLSGDPTKADPRQVMMQLKVFPWQLLPGQSWTTQWSSQSPAQSYGTSFTDQGLAFTASAGLAPATIAGLPGIVPGLSFVIDGSQANPVVRIRFPQPSVVTSLTGLVYEIDGEFTFVNQPQCFGDGAALTPESASQDTSSQTWTVTFQDNGTPIQELTVPVAGRVLILYALDYSTAPVPMAILPEAPALYALKTTTRIEASRVGSGSYQTVPNGDPIVEFVYFQTASGPGTATGFPAPTVLPSPSAAPPHLKLVANCSTVQQPTAAFPLAGAIEDLRTYTQWSWPLDGAAAAYYGYDLNVEFVESYVNALYTAFSGGSIGNSLHFRCVDRNNVHTLLVPNAIHVPSIPQESALVAGSLVPPLPKPLQTPTRAPGSLTHLQLAALEQRALLVMAKPAVPDAVPEYLAVEKLPLLKETTIGLRTGVLGIQQIDPGHAGAILHQLEENSAAQEALTLWFKPLLPSTRYTLDVVAGPWYRSPDRAVLANFGSDKGSLGAVYSATDAIGVLAALKAYYAYEDGLTTLERVQFATSRYATFTAQLSNAVAQLAAAPGTAPIRHYVAATEPTTWFGTAGPQVSSFGQAGLQYLEDHANMQTLVSGFDPLADDRQPGPAPASNGAGALVQLRQQTAADWKTFAASVNVLYDGLITAVGHPEMASKAAPIRVPDTEISLFTDDSGAWVEAILLESPEPLPWQRIWRWIHFTSASGKTVVLLPLWNADGTRGLLVPLQRLVGTFQLSIAFQGTIGAEAPCITQGGNPFTEPVAVGPVVMGPFRIRGPFTPVEKLVETAAHLEPLAQVLRVKTGFDSVR
jgi:hypothetical protein